WRSNQHGSVSDLKQFGERVNKALPGQSVTFGYLIAEGDLVSVHMTATQTLSRGERVSFHVTAIAEIKDGKILWRRTGLDRAGHAVGPRTNQQ
ncbi:MAG: nuclear transport factor 2 family protein, partial [Candidatus Sulfotelmatobacter sp.]